MNTKRNFMTLKMDLLVALHEWSLNPESGAYFEARFASGLIGVGLGMGEQLIRELLDDGMISIMGSYSPTRYEITRSLIEKAEAISKFLSPEPTTAPASDRIVTLDHNEPEYKEAVSALDKVVAEFSADHRFDNELGAEKGALLKALESGRELLNDTQVRVDAALSLIIGPLKILATRYEKEIVGGGIVAFVTAAITAVMKLIGLG